MYEREDKHYDLFGLKKVKEKKMKGKEAENEIIWNEKNVYFI